MKIALAQINPIVGDLSYNCQKILAAAKRAKEHHAELVVFPELSLLGYPPKDLLLRADFLDAIKDTLSLLAKETPLPLIVGAALKKDAHEAPLNTAVLCENGQWKVVGEKHLLPNYNVFDEKRYFTTPKHQACSLLVFKNQRMLISICEDAWSNVLIDEQKKHAFDPILNGLKEHGGADIIINMSASPYTKTKPKIREEVFTSLANTHQLPVLLVGQVGANDQLLFDGHTMIIDNFGQVTKRSHPHDEDLLFYDTDAKKLSAIPPLITDEELLMEMLTMGIRDYVEKCRMPEVIIGVSGGIDSAVCLALSVKALGTKRVRAVFLPSKFSSPQSLADAKELCANLSIPLESFSIEENVNLLRHMLTKNMNEASSAHQDLADQNLQSRMRGLIIMALTNIYGSLMIATSNKSELAVGYSTIYGDMCGALSAIGDLYKTEVWTLSHTINKNKIIIPLSTINRAPTAELKYNQFDTDNLPDFSLLDQILFNFIDLEKSAQEIHIITGLPDSLIDGIIRKVNQSEYKRRQAPFALMVSDKVFGDARRLPIAKPVSLFTKAP